MPTQLPSRIKVEITPNAVLIRKELGLQIGLIAAMWSSLEYSLGRALADILGLDVEIGMNIYLSLSQEGAKRSVLKEIAKNKLPKHLREEFEDIIESIRTKSDGRNKIVHGLWGTADEYPDALIWVDPRNALRWHSRSAPRGLEALLSDSIDNDPMPMLLYKMKDFEEVLDNAIDIAYRLIDFNKNLIRFKYPENDYISELISRSKNTQE